MDSFLKAEGIWKSYPQGAGELEILKGISLDIKQGEAISILGSSGAGKSTFLQILGTLDQPNRGTLTYYGKDLFALTDEQLAKFRNDTMGFVFQFHHLLAEFDALENVMIPCRISGMSEVDAMARAAELLDILGLQGRHNHYPNQLSGGELQRVAIARALVRRPKILFADEPTGNLDSANSLRIQDLFFQLREKFGLTLIVVTHDLEFANRFPKVLKMQDGCWKV